MKMMAKSGLTREPVFMPECARSSWPAYWDCHRGVHEEVCLKKTNLSPHSGQLVSAHRRKKLVALRTSERQAEGSRQRAGMQRGSKTVGFVRVVETAALADATVRALPATGHNRRRLVARLAFEHRQCHHSTRAQPRMCGKKGDTGEQKEITRSEKWKAKGLTAQRA